MAAGASLSMVPLYVLDMCMISVRVSAVRGMVDDDTVRALACEDGTRCWLSHHGETHVSCTFCQPEALTKQRACLRVDVKVRVSCR